ncbi:MAG TPA: hemolysin III [Clostridiales bacterium]|nr:hemolysin III [Clostridiales bacterium]
MSNTYQYTLGEEVANTITHGVMAALCLLALPFATIWVLLQGELIDAIGVSIFVISIFLMFLSSTLYHSMAKDTKHKRVFRIFDHIFIYVAIAGSYTPVALSVIGRWQGIVITSLQWVMVIFGILQKTLTNREKPKSYVAVYIIMGWTVLAFLPLFIKKAAMELVALILLGGVFYSVGAVIFKKKAFKYYHMVWHFFVNAGAIAHFIGITFYIYK